MPDKHPMSEDLRHPAMVFGRRFYETCLAAADELDRLHAIEQEARKHYLTADGVLVLDDKTPMWVRRPMPEGMDGYVEQLDMRLERRPRSSLYSTREAAEAQREKPCQG